MKNINLIDILKRLSHMPKNQELLKYLTKILNNSEETYLEQQNCYVATNLHFGLRYAIKEQNSTLLKILMECKNPEHYIEYSDLLPNMIINSTKQLSLEFLQTLKSYLPQKYDRFPNNKYSLLDSYFYQNYQTEQNYKYHVTFDHLSTEHTEVVLLAYEILNVDPEKILSSIIEESLKSKRNTNIDYFLFCEKFVDKFSISIQDYAFIIQNKIFSNLFKFSYVAFDKVDQFSIHEDLPVYQFLTNIIKNNYPLFKEIQAHIQDNNNTNNNLQALSIYYKKLDALYSKEKLMQNIEGITLESKKHKIKL